MNAVEEFKPVLTLDQVQQLGDFDACLTVEAISSTQLLLDELLGRFEDDYSVTFLAQAPASEVIPDPVEFCLSENK